MLFTTPLSLGDKPMEWRTPQGDIGRKEGLTACYLTVDVKKSRQVIFKNKTVCVSNKFLTHIGIWMAVLLFHVEQVTIKYIVAKRKP